MKRNLKQYIVLLVLIFVMVLPITVNAKDKEKITVSLMEKTLDFKVAPKNIDGRVMVPLRKIFEDIGLEVGWQASTKKITGKKPGTLITLQVGNNYATMNGEGRYIDAPPVIIDGSTLVPVRFISESTGLDVVWDGDTKTVYIKQPKKAVVYRENSNKFVAGYGKIGTFNLASSGSILNIDGKIKNSGKNLIGIYDKAGNQKLQCVVDCKENGDIKANVDLQGLNGSYTLKQFVEDKHKDNYFNGYYTDIPINIKNNKISFELPITYEGNYNSMLNRANVYTDTYLNLDYLKSGEKKELIQLANNIVKGKTTDHEKILAIHDWLIDNIYYNFDGLYSGDYGANDAYSVYKNKKAVCQGYANLFKALGRISGVPTREASGYSLGIGAIDSWNKESLNQRSNHAWNEAFVDGRWIIVDATWDTTNAYENGKFVKGEKFHKYFDPSLQYFSLTHRILSE